MAMQATAPNESSFFILICIRLFVSALQRYKEKENEERISKNYLLKKYKKHLNNGAKLPFETCFFLMLC